MKGVLAGPPCRTFSRLRNAPTSGGGPRPLRGATGDALWALGGLTQTEKDLVDGDSVLVAHVGRRVHGDTVEGLQTCSVFTAVAGYVAPVAPVEDES